MEQLGLRAVVTFEQPPVDHMAILDAMVRPSRLQVDPDADALLMELPLQWLPSDHRSVAPLALASEETLFNTPAFRPLDSLEWMAWFSMFGHVVTLVVTISSGSDDEDEERRRSATPPSVETAQLLVQYATAGAYWRCVDSLHDRFLMLREAASESGSVHLTRCRLVNWHRANMEAEKARIRPMRRAIEDLKLALRALDCAVSIAQQPAWMLPIAEFFRNWLHQSVIDVPQTNRVQGLYDIDANELNLDGTNDSIAAASQATTAWRRVLELVETWCLKWHLDHSCIDEAAAMALLQQWQIDGSVGLLHFVSERLNDEEQLFLVCVLRRAVKTAKQEQLRSQLTAEELARQAEEVLLDELDREAAEQAAKELAKKKKAKKKSRHKDMKKSEDSVAEEVEQAYDASSPISAEQPAVSQASSSIDTEDTDIAKEVLMAVEAIMDESFVDVTAPETKVDGSSRRRVKKKKAEKAEKATKMVVPTSTSFTPAAQQDDADELDVKVLDAVAKSNELNEKRSLGSNREIVNAIVEDKKRLSAAMALPLKESATESAFDTGRSTASTATTDCGDSVSVSSGGQTRTSFTSSQQGMATFAPEALQTHNECREEPADALLGLSPFVSGASQMKGTEAVCQSFSAPHAALAGEDSRVMVATALASHLSELFPAIRVHVGDVNKDREQTQHECRDEWQDFLKQSSELRIPLTKDWQPAHDKTSAHVEPPDPLIGCGDTSIMQSSIAAEPAVSFTKTTADSHTTEYQRNWYDELVCGNERVASSMQPASANIGILNEPDVGGGLSPATTTPSATSSRLAQLRTRGMQLLSQIPGASIQQPRNPGTFDDGQGMSDIMSMVNTVPLQSFPQLPQNQDTGWTQDARCSNYGGWTQDAFEMETPEVGAPLDWTICSAAPYAVDSSIDWTCAPIPANADQVYNAPPDSMLYASEVSTAALFHGSCNQMLPQFITGPEPGEDVNAFAARLRAAAPSSYED